MRKILSLAAAVASAFAMGSAQAEFLLVDSFNQPAGQVSSADALGGGYSQLFNHALTGQIATNRIIEQNLLANPLNLANPTVVTVGGGAGGFLNMSHDSGADSDVRITWEIDSFVLPPVQSAILFQVLFSNIGTPGAPMDLAFEFRDAGNVLQWSKNVQVGSVAASAEQFGLLATEATAFAAGGKLQLVVSGTPGWDFVVDEFSISIPEPTSLALVGLALVGAGVVSRRRKA
jgi:PEP-CTERM motif